MPTSPLERKLAYVENLASEQGIDLSMDRLGGVLDDLNLSIDFNCLFRFWLDMFTNLDLYLDFSQFKWWNLDFGSMFTPEFPKVEKGVYGKSYYENFIYDPELPTGLDLENSLWHMRKHTTETDKPFWKQQSVALKNYVEIIKNKLKEKGVADHYTDSMEALLAMVEGKVFNASYVGFAFVGLNRVMHDEGKNIVPFDSRKEQDWKTIWKVYTGGLYDSLVGIARVGYSRVGSIEIRPKPELAEKFQKQVKEFKERAGKVAVEYPSPAYLPSAYGYVQPTYGYAPIKPELLYPRAFMYQRVDQYHYNGGSHQIKLQTLINRIKQLLDREGIMAQQRMSYIAYAQELYYLEYDPHRLWKRWKQILSRSDLRTKYIGMGMDEAILSKIEDVVR
jgi:hypothetical protein